MFFWQKLAKIFGYFLRPLLERGSLFSCCSDRKKQIYLTQMQYKILGHKLKMMTRSGYGAFKVTYLCIQSYVGVTCACLCSEFAMLNKSLKGCWQTNFTTLMWQVKPSAIRWDPDPATLQLLTTGHVLFLRSLRSLFLKR